MVLRRWTKSRRGKMLREVDFNGPIPSDIATSFIAPIDAPIDICACAAPQTGAGRARNRAASPERPPRQVAQGRPR
eukprot:4460676-Pyramimonas_sp.AAC.1